MVTNDDYQVSMSTALQYHRMVLAPGLAPEDSTQTQRNTRYWAGPQIETVPIPLLWLNPVKAQLEPGQTTPAVILPSSLILSLNMNTRVASSLMACGGYDYVQLVS